MKYFVEIPVMCKITLEVEAENCKKAIIIANECLEKGENQDGSPIQDEEYYETLDTDEWGVYAKESV